nr:adenosylcobinamide-phosphate synthase CbiB [Endozoicomonas sp. OPT23]
MPDFLFDLLFSPAIQLTIALLLDQRFGELNRWHPLIGFGRYVKWLEQKLYPVKNSSDGKKLVSGSLAALIALLPVYLLVTFVAELPAIGWLLEVFILYLVIGKRSLAEHGGYVSTALKNGDLEEARTKVGWLVSRQTDSLKPPEIIRATIESVLENGNDAVFGAVFWFIVAGAPGAVIYRMVNTLDAMWGYKNDKYLFFGRFAARSDDLLNLIPAQLCALTYALFGNTKRAVHCWFSQGHTYKSFNGGAVMASGAGSLNIILGGSAVYHGQVSQGIQLGEGSFPETEDIDRATALVNKGIWLWAVIFLLTSLTSFYFH